MALGIGNHLEHGDKPNVWDVFMSVSRERFSIRLVGLFLMRFFGGCFEEGDSKT